MEVSGVVRVEGLDEEGCDDHDVGVEVWKAGDRSYLVLRDRN